MPTPANSLNITSAGYQKFNGTSAFSANSIIPASDGGTGVNNGTSTITLGGSLTTSGAFASTFTMTGATSVTFPTSGTLATTSQLISTPVSPANGGTGIANNNASTLTISGNFASTFTVTNTTSVTFPTSGTLATTSQLPSITATQFDVLVGGAANAVVSVGPGSAGQVLQSGGNAANPAYSTATYPATAGTSGKVLISDGTNIVSSTPTFPNASATSGKFIQSDGTNWLASTPTLPTTAGTASTLLRSDGTNFVNTTATYPATATGTGTILRADGTNWVASTNTYPNTATTGDILIATGTNVIGSLPDVAVGQVLVSGGVGAAPAYSATPTVTSIKFGTGSALSTYVQSGSWTPAIAFGGSSTGITYSTQVGTYTQIGNMVFYKFTLILTNKGVQTGTATLTGFPVSEAGQTDYINVPFSNNMTISGVLVLQISASTGTFFQNSSGTVTQLSDTAFTSTTVIRGSGYYFA